MSDKPLENRVRAMFTEALNFSMSSVLARVCDSYGFEELSNGWQRPTQSNPLISIADVDDIVVTYDSHEGGQEDYVFRFSIDKRKVEMTYISQDEKSMWKKYRMPQVNGDFMLAFSELVRDSKTAKNGQSGIVINMLVPAYDLYSVLSQIIDHGDLKEQFEKSSHAGYKA